MGREAGAVHAVGGDDGRAVKHVGKMADKKKISERSFIAVKPDGVQRGLVGEIVRRFEVKGFKLVAMKMLMVGCNAD